MLQCDIFQIIVYGVFRNLADQKEEIIGSSK